MEDKYLNQALAIVENATVAQSGHDGAASV